MKKNSFPLILTSLIAIDLTAIGEKENANLHNIQQRSISFSNQSPINGGKGYGK